MVAKENTVRDEDIVPNPDPSVITTAHIDKETRNLELRLLPKIEAIEKSIQVFREDLTRVPTSLDRAILSLREIIETRLVCQENDIKGVHAFLETRGKDIAEQIVHLRELIHSNIAGVDERIEKLAAVSTERFTRIETQFVERDKRTDQLSLADKTAVAAALQAAKEAVGAQNTSNSIAIAKSESSTIESIKQLQALFNTSFSALKDSINDIKSRQDKGEGKTSISDPAVADGMKQLAAMMADLSKSRDTHAGQSQGVGMVGSIILGAFSFIAAISAIVAIVIAIKT